MASEETTRADVKLVREMLLVREEDTWNHTTSQT